MDELTSAGVMPAEMNDTDLSDVLTQSIDCLTDLGEDYSSCCDELKNLKQRLAEGRFHLAVLGQFKRGKSTLLNALLGDDLLPTDILPVTAIPTFISFGSELSVRVYFTNQEQPILFTPADGKPLSDFLQDYVTEAGNPHNERQVEKVEISHPSELLQQGVVLIDTPGIGSTLKHNTEVAHQILPQCDAALFLVSPDPPITEMELEYLGQIKLRLPRTFYLLNKVDFLDEKERLDSLQFLTEQLSRFYSSAPQVMPISARMGLRAREAGDKDGWQQSGMQLVEKSLVDFLPARKNKPCNRH
jgi:ribosome biogenesis GTPase A